MIELKHEEKIKLNNFGAQLSSIRTNISVANTELESALLKKAEAEKAYKHLCTEVENKLVELDKLLETEERVSKELSAKEQTLRIREDALGRKAQEFLAFKDEESKRLKEHEAILSASIGNIKKEISDLKEKASVAEKDAQIATAMVSSLDESIKSLSDKKSQLERDIADLELKHIEEEKRIAQALAEAKSELQSVYKTLAEERARIGKPREIFEEEVAAFKNKERNFAILLNRYRVHFKELYPNLNPPM